MSKLSKINHKKATCKEALGFEGEEVFEKFQAIVSDKLNVEGGRTISQVVEILEQELNSREMAFLLLQMNLTSDDAQSSKGKAIVSLN
tara:strand:+ start:3082 stop:3345 length:264 start_codon:yes stop_codon:yes gene_type:complete